MHCPRARDGVKCGAHLRCRRSPVIDSRRCLSPPVIESRRVRSPPLPVKFHKQISVRHTNRCQTLNTASIEYLWSICTRWGFACTDTLACVCIQYSLEFVAQSVTGYGEPAPTVSARDRHTPHPRCGCGWHRHGAVCRVCTTAFELRISSK